MAARKNPIPRTRVPWLLCTLILLVLVVRTWIDPAGVQAGRRTLYIILDAVPYHVAAEVTDPSRAQGALFKDLRGPVPIVSTYPTSTSVAMPGLLAPFGLETSPGYEARFFDWEENKVRGGGPISYGRIKFPWRDFFDLTRKGPVPSAFQGLHPIGASIKRLEKGIDAFMRTDKDPYWVYIAETDLSVHLKGPGPIKRVFVALDKKLRAVRERNPDRPFDVVIFSDHGVAGDKPLKNTWPLVRKALDRAGYRYARSLKQPKDVVLTPLGLVSNFEAYTYEEDKPAVAQVLAQVPGVDLCVFKTEDGWTIESNRGRAVFRRYLGPAGLFWLYRPITGDPLDYAPLIDAYRRQNEAQSDWLPDSAWFQITASSRYPDALFRLARSFELVRNPASVACSLAPGYMYGARRTDYLCRLGSGPLRWTHGALYREATLGFLMSDVTGWDPPGIARFNTALLPFARATYRKRRENR